MRVLHINWSFTVGGAENRLIDQFRHFSPSVESHLLIVNDHYDQKNLAELPSNITVHLINRPISSKNPFHFLKLNYLVRKINPQVIIFHVANLISLFPKGKNYKKVLHLHNVHEDLKKYLHGYDGFIAISDAVSKYINSYSPSASTRVIYNGIPISKYKYRRNWVPGGRFKIIQVGRLNDQIKGQGFFLNVMKRLAMKREFTAWSLDFVGDGPSRPFLENLSIELGLQKNVRFLGQKPAEFLYNHLRDYDLLVLPSFTEGLGNTIIEGMAAKVPVLVSNLPGPMEVINGGDYGSYFDSGNIDDCMDKILNIKGEYGSAKFINKVNLAHVYAQDMFDINNMANKVENYCAEISTSKI